MTCSLPYTSFCSRVVWLAAAVAAALGAVRAAPAADWDGAREQFRKGRYSECLERARQAIKDGAYATDWRLLEIESLLALGRYDEAAQHVDKVLRDSRADIRLLRLAHTAYLHNGQAGPAAAMLDMIARIASYRRIEYLTSAEAVALGQSLLLLGAEPRLVLEHFYNRARQNDPNCRDAYLAAGELAIAKQDYELAAEQYRDALKRFGDDPDAHYGLAAAFYLSDRKAMIASLDTALHVNPRHAPALVLLADHQIDAEDYDGAAKSLDRVLAVNPWYPDAWAYRAVLAHLANEPNVAGEHRASALKFWPTNPQVDYLIGKKLSQKYRFTEGAAWQRQALEADPNYLPARLQLAQDLLRLGDEQQGWALGDEVNRKDPYNVEAYNLVHLRDTLSEFETLTADGLLLKMDPREAAVYGDRVLRLLLQAKSELCRRYGLELNHPVTVELFPNQQDFAVRTFGMPGGDGFLGVCFGNVITATSPRIERRSNWEATLWHEFAHAVTLNLTNNRMPRWLSEGISVFEELQQNPAWGQRMNPQYRRMILDGELTPLSELSTAFMSPASPVHLQFAYYESLLAVEFLVDRFGFAALQAILADLGQGQEVNAAIARHTGPLRQIEKDFKAFARKRAEELAPGLDWEQPEKGQLNAADPPALEQWLARHPDNFWALGLYANHLLAKQQWERAKAPLTKLISLYPTHVAEGNAYQLLATAHRNLGETDLEVQVLSDLAARSADATEAYDRLMEVYLEQGDWAQAAENGERYLRVYPLLAATYRRLGRAAEALGRNEQAADAYRRLLLLDPTDPVDVNYRLARLLQQQDPAAAKRYILEALADAPRFRQGHQLLLKIREDTGTHLAETAPGDAEPSGNEEKPQ